MKVKNMTITPNMAEKILNTAKESGFHNRPVSEVTVTRYASDINKGLWKNNSLIQFNENGILLDGQHRLLACIRSGKPIDVIAAYGVDSDAFITVDCGRNRSKAQCLQSADIQYSSEISTFSGAYDCLVNYNGNSLIGKNRSGLTTNSKVSDFYMVQNDAEGFVNSARFAKNLCTLSTTPFTVKVIGAVHYYLVHNCKQNAERVERMLNDIASNDTSSVAALNKLRCAFTKIKENSKRLNLNSMLYAIQVAWNATVTNDFRVVRSLVAKYNKSQSQFTTALDNGAEKMPGFQFSVV